MLVALCLLGASRASAQPVASAGSFTDTLRVASVRFEGNTLYPDETLALLVRTRANRRFLGVPGLTWWLWLYRAGNAGRFGRFSDALADLGEPPAYADALTLAADAERLQALYRQEGYRDAEVAVEVDSLQRAQLAVTFHIEKGAASYLRRVAYDVEDGRGQPAVDAETARRLAEASVLDHRAVETDASGMPAFDARSQRYSESLLLEERRRMLAALRDEGFAAISRDSIRALVYPAGRDSFDVTFRVRTGEKVRFGGVDVRVTGPETGVPPRRDTLEGAYPVALDVQDERRLRASLVSRALRIEPGAVFSQDAVLATKRQLEATGVFSFTRLAPVWADTFRAGGVLHLPYTFELRTRPRHALRFETFALQRSGVLAGSDSELGTGVGVTYDNLNLRGSGETLRLRSAGSVSADLDGARLFTSGQLETSATVTLPYGLLGWRPLVPPDRTPRTQLSTSLLTARRDDLGLVIRARLGARLRLELPHSSTIRSTVDLLDLSLSDPDTLGRFSAFLNGFLDEIDDPLQRAQIREEILENYTRPQVSTVVRYTFSSGRFNPLRREQGYLYEASMAAGGYAEALFDSFVFTPGTVEGTVPSVLGGRRPLVYRPYVRFTGDARRYVRMTPRRVLAFKLSAGTVLATGTSGVVPFDQRFYSGGATSVRGWRLRSLGPGRVSFQSAGEVANVLGGDVWLEAGAELRQTLIPALLNAEVVGVAFVDAGNVWLGPRNPGFGAQNDAGRFAFDTFYRELGVGSGAGLRLVWTYLVVRFDFATRIHDPAQPGALLPNGPRPLVHFGLGHAF